MKVLQQRSIAPFHTFGIDINAKHVLVAESAEDLIAIWRDQSYIGLPKLILGQGSNLLFCEDYAGVIILNRIQGLEVSESKLSFHLHVGAGEDWHHLVETCINEDIAGLENLALIPGCVGSSPIQNIGAYGVELKDVCEYVDVLELSSGEVSRMDAQACQFGYRDSIFKHQLKGSHAIIAVGFCLPKAWQPRIAYGALSQLNLETVKPRDIFELVCQIRIEKLPDPSQLGNAGSFFKNPVVTPACYQELNAAHPNMPAYKQADGDYKLAAGWLIDQAGLKGFSIGGAKVHELQALVLVNFNKARAIDVLRLAQHVVTTVEQRFNVVLEHEVRFMAATQETNLNRIVDEGL